MAAQYASSFRHDWLWAREAPHFSNNERFERLLNNPNNATYLHYRGFLTAEAIKKGDRLLDIGCGDGFYAFRFYSHKCKHIDAIDIDPGAIAYANKYNKAGNIHYLLRDAVSIPFPAERYNVIAWDGAIGHFAPETTGLMLKKIREALDIDGIFVGSESLGTGEGHDHLQFFETISDLAAMLKMFFSHVSVRECSYEISPSFVRREAYWRCSNSEKFKERFAWLDIP